nr:hypothetical protein [Methylobacterium sp. 37f]
MGSLPDISDGRSSMPFLLAVAGMLATGLAYWIRYGDGMVQIDHTLHDWRKGRRRRAGDLQQRLAPLKAMREPADAAGVLLTLVARQRGVPTPEQENEILSRMRSITAIPEEDLAIRMAVIRHAANQSPDNQDAIAVLAPLLHDRLTPYEVEDLVDMLQAVASLHGGPTEGQSHLIDQVHRAIIEDR